MSFFCLIRRGRFYGVEVGRVDVPVTILTDVGATEIALRLDTGAYITTISEDVAALCGLPPGGTPISLTGIGGRVAGRLIDVRVRFPPDAISGTAGREVTARWAVIPGRTDTKLLSLMDVHEHFSIGTDDAFMHFAER